MASTPTRRQYIFGVGLAVLVGIGLYGLLPQFSQLDGSLEAMQQAEPGLVILAATVSILGSFCAAGLYMLLSLKKLRYRPTLLVQISGLLINRVLPAGIGGLGLNFMYLRAHRHTAPQASAVVAINNFLGFVGHMSLLAVGLLLALIVNYSTDLKLPSFSVTWLAALVLILLVGLMLIRVARGNTRYKLGRRLVQQLGMIARQYARRPRKFIAALSVSMLMTMCNVVAFGLCCLALDVPISALAVFFIFTLGIAAGTATPTPGGLGGLEAAMVAGLVTQNVDLPLAVAAVLLYRLISYWLGLLLGTGAFTLVQKQKLLQQNT